MPFPSIIGFVKAGLTAGRTQIHRRDPFATSSADQPGRITCGASGSSGQGRNKVLAQGKNVVYLKVRGFCCILDGTGSFRMIST
jgi:hypothetical protein